MVEKLIYHPYYQMETFRGDFFQSVLQLVMCCCQGSWNLSAIKSPCGRGGARPARVLVSEQAVQQETTVNHCRQDDARAVIFTYLRTHWRASSLVIVKGGLKGVLWSGEGRDLWKRRAWMFPSVGFITLLKKWLCYMENSVFLGSRLLVLAL